MSKYTNKMVEFLNGANTIIIRGDRDFTSFKSMMKKVGLDFNFESYWDLLHIAEFNHCAINYSTILVEYQPYKGFSFGYKSFDESEKWYEQKPWTVQEVRQSLN